MKKQLILISFFLLLYSCSTKYSKKHYVNTIIIEIQLYYEIFQTYLGSIIASDSFSN